MHSKQKMLWTEECVTSIRISYWKVKTCTHEEQLWNKNFVAFRAVGWLTLYLPHPLPTDRMNINNING